MPIVKTSTIGRSTFLTPAVVILLVAAMGSNHPAPAPASDAGLGMAAQDSSPIVVLQTSRGEIWIQLYPDESPNSVARFLELVRAGFYEEMLFHRVVRDFAIQTGLMDMEGHIRGHDYPALKNESDNRVKNMRGTVAMARENRPHSATTEFFINVRDNWDLNFNSYSDWGYTVFGEVVDGMDVVVEISAIRTRRLGPFREFPAEPVAVYRAYVLQ